MAWNPSFNFKLRDDEVTLGPLILDRGCAEMIANLLLDIKAGVNVNIEVLDAIVKAGCFTDDEFMQVHTEFDAIQEDVKIFRKIKQAWDKKFDCFLAQTQHNIRYITGSDTWFQKYVNMKSLAASMYKSLLDDRVELPAEKQSEWANRYRDVLVSSTPKELDDRLVRNQFAENIASGMDVDEAVKIRREISIMCGLWDEKMTALLDGQKTYRIFENLIVNVTKYAMPHTRVFVDIFGEENEIVVQMKNVSKDELTFNPQEITERFVRGDESRNTEGSGLGLAIAKSIVELHRGTIRVESSPETGTAFLVSLTECAK